MTVCGRPIAENNDNAARLIRIAEEEAAGKPDIVCFPEEITLAGSGKGHAEVSEPIPGPTTKRLGELARRLHAYVVAGINEREGEVLYNSAVLIGRDGRLEGKYRKTHLPREEFEAGLTPGDCYPVFETDFGKIGLIVCWDVRFPEPARAMAAQGAELLLLPIWGGSELLARARALENQVYLVSSSYDMRSFIVGPEGDILAEATQDNPAAIAEIDLDREILLPHLGDMKPRTWREWRPDLLPGGSLARPGSWVG